MTGLKYGLKTYCRGNSHRPEHVNKRKVDVLEQAKLANIVTASPQNIVTASLTASLTKFINLKSLYIHISNIRTRLSLKTILKLLYGQISGKIVLASGVSKHKKLKREVHYVWNFGLYF